VMLPALFASAEQAGDARIVMIGSIGGRIAGPILGAYQAAKHGLVGLTGALRAELAPFGIKVLLIEPGAIATPIWNRGAAAGEETRADNPEIAARYGRQLAGSAAMVARGNRSGLPPRVPAAVNMDALQSRKPAPRRVVGRDAKIIAALVRVLPFRAVYRMTRGT
jgi:NAD(P)-dependent dehydrogenase (short-subunit alcohol dehydrogenase family)